MRKSKAVVLVSGVLFLTAVLLLALGSSTDALAVAEGFMVTKVAANGTDSPPCVSGDRIVWEGRVGTSSTSEIFTWTPAGGTVQITSNTYQDQDPDVSGDRIVWERWSGHDYEVYTWTPSGGAVRLTNSIDVYPIYVDPNVQVAGDRIVWETYRVGESGDPIAHVFTWTPAGGTVYVGLALCPEPMLPKVSANRVVWQSQEWWSENWQISTWTPAGGEVRLTNNTGGNGIYDLNPDISGDRIVWQSWDGIDSEIYTWTPTGGTVRLTNNTFNDGRPRVSGNRIVWQAGGPTYFSPFQIFTWTSGGGVTQPISSPCYGQAPEVSGDRIVWQRWDGTDFEILTWAPTGGAVVLTDNSLDDSAPCVSGDRVVWHASNGSGWEVYTAVPSLTPSTSLRGTDRYDTALKLSKAQFPTSLPADSGLVLAPGETFPQALCGAPLAAAYGGPVLLNPMTGLNNAVKAELQRLVPKYVFCIGFSTTVVSAVQAALPTATVTSLTGADVYAMSRSVANALAAKVGTAGKMTAATAIITCGDKFPDAIGVSPLACAKKWPIILTPAAGALHVSAAGALSDLGITQTIKVGTYVTMPAGVTALANLSGADRYQTNANVATWAKNNAGLAFTHIGIATGDKFPDALASGPFLAKDSGLLLLSPLNGPLQPVTSALITANRADVQKCTFIAMIEPVIGQVKALLP